MYRGAGSNDDFVMLDISHEYLKIDEDPTLDEEAKMAQAGCPGRRSKRKERAHNLRQLLRAHLLMEKDVDYIIQDNKIVIIDENTGRPQPGRRFSDGLHQAIEAKEGRRNPERDADICDDHSAELLPHVEKAVRDDRHSRYRS